MSGSFSAPADVLDHWARERPSATALSSGQARLSYVELRSEVDAAAARLRAGGVGLGQRIGLLMGHDLRSVVTVLALSACGACPVLIDPKSTLAEQESVRAIAALHDLVEPLPVGDLAVGPAPPTPQAKATPSPWFGLVSSGTNGVPKVVRRSWRTTLDNCAAFADTAGYSHRDRILCTTSVHHSYAFGVALVAGLISGAEIVLAPVPVRPASVAPLLEQVTVIQSVPFLYRMLIPAVSVRPESVRLCVSAGEPLDPALAIAWEKAVGVPLSNHYGSSETGIVTLADPGDLVSVGRPVPGVRVKVDEVGEDGDSGELWVDIPGEQSQYLGQTELSRQAFPGRWHRTGDRGRIEGASVVLTGRVVPQIVVAGKKVDPKEVEETLRLHPEVKDCIVRPDQLSASESLPGSEQRKFAAFVESSSPLSEIELRVFLAKRLSGFKIPGRIHVLPAFPRSASGKVHMPRLLDTVRTP